MVATPIVPSAARSKRVSTLRQTFIVSSVSMPALPPPRSSDAAHFNAILPRKSLRGDDPLFLSAAGSG